MLPLTKSLPKEMLPVFNKPAIQYVVEEAIASGIDDILIITGKGKRAIEEHLTPNIDLEKILIEKGMDKELSDIRKIGEGADIYYVHQKSPRGLGDAIMFAEKHVGGEPFVVLLGDDIIFNDIPAVKQLISVYWKYDSPVLGVERVPVDEVSRYGIIKPGKVIGDGVVEIDDLVEKPRKEEAPSNYAIIGRYLLTPEIFTYLRKVKPDQKGEIQLTDALRMYNMEHRLLAVELEGRRVDIGNPEGWLMANIEAVKRENPQLSANIKEILD
jgi:UTP--glucose-1-phosphate uridylyltransferase